VGEYERRLGWRREDPGWNPGLNEAEALAGPGRFFYGFYYAENDWVYVDVDDLWYVVAGR